MTQPALRPAPALPFGFRPKEALYDYQSVGVKVMAIRTYMGLFDEPGLGKTAQALCTFGELQQARQTDCMVVVTKRMLIDTWLDEIAKFTDFHPCVLAGKPAADRKNWPFNHKIYLINYDLLGRSLCSIKERKLGVGVECGGATIKGDAQNLLFLMQNKHVTLVLDESQAIRTPDAKVTRVLLALRSAASHRYILSATPAADKPENVWSQINFLDGGLLLGKSYPAFLAHYARQVDGKFGPVTVGYRNLDELHRKLKTVSIRRTAKECLDLPEKVIQTRRVRAEGKHSVVMRRLAEKALDTLGGYSGRFIIVKADEPLAKLIQDMQRASVCPWLVDPACRTSSMMEALIDMRDEYTGPLVVWCVHRNVAEEVAVAFTKSGSSAQYIHGGVSQKERTEIIDRFSAGKFSNLVATLASLKEGVNKLVVAQYSIYCQMDWSLLSWIQSQGRLHRIGQTRTVFITNMILDKSLGGYIRDAVDRKEVNVNQAIDGSMISIKLDKVKFTQAISSW